MSIDRILQLKLVTDVGNINQQMSGVEQSVGRVGGAFNTLKGFAGPIAINAALTAVSTLTDAISGGAAAMRAYDDAVFGVGQTLGDMDQAETIAADLASLSTSLGFGDDVSVIEGFGDALIALGGDADMATLAVTAAMDVARVKGIEVGEAVDLVVKGVATGGQRYARELGTTADTAVGRLDEITAAFGGSAGAFTETAEGMRQVADAELGDVFENIGGAVNDLADTALPVLLSIWQEVKPLIFDAISVVGPIAQDIFSGIADAVGRMSRLLAALAPAFQTAWSLIAPIVTAMGEAIGGTIGGILDIIDAIILVLEGGSIEEAFALAFGGIVDIVKAPINLMLGGVEAGLNFLGNAFFGALEAIRANLNGIAFVGDQVPDEPITWGGVSIPRLAAGGIVTRPTLAMIGEAGAEAVVPLSRGGGMGTTINVYAAAASPADVGRSVVEAIEAYERRSGSAWRAA